MRPGWTRFTGLGVEFSYPTDGAQRNEDAQRVHISSVDRQELYFEVARFPDLKPHDEYARHKPYLEGRFGQGSVTELTETSEGAWTYSFSWDEEGRPMERTALLLAVGADTCRVIRDPRSPLNDEVLATLKLV
jgi:YD repeat-containing protein